MATVNGITAARAQAIEDASIVSGSINVNGHLILTTAGGTTIDAGLVIDSAGLVAHEADTSTHGVTEIVGRTEPQILTNKTLTTPIIASFVNSLHTHGDSAGGGPLAIGVANNPMPVTTLTQFNLADGDPVRTMASLTLAPGRWLILATCEGVTMGAATTTRFTYDLKSSVPTMTAKPVSTSSTTTTINGGASLTGWLENASTSTVTFTILKNGTGALVTNSTNGQLVAIRMG